MKKQKYYYNSSTLTYEPEKRNWWRIFLKAFAYFSSVFMLAVLLSFLFLNVFETPNERVAKRQLQEMNTEYVALTRRVNRAEEVLKDLSSRDKNIYRVIFEAEPSPNRFDIQAEQNNLYANLLHLPSGELIKSLKERTDQLEQEVAMQIYSYQETIQSIKKKENMLSSVPAIIPIPESKTVRLSSGFKMRFHPIYRTLRMHTGIDITAPTGTEIHVTGDGVVKEVQKLRTGYGQHVVVDHGFGYETLYAHMSKIDVSKGQKLSRGQVIGEVGSTGTSTAPHLHYEVHKDGQKINPIHFFFNDLSPDEYDEIIKRAEESNQSFD